MLFKTRACETLFPVDIKFLIGYHHFGGYDIFKTPEFGTPFLPIAVFAFKPLKPVNGEGDDVPDILQNFGHLLLQ